MNTSRENKIQDTLQQVSDSFSPNPEHFKKILASLDMEVAHSTPKTIFRKNTLSPYSFFQTRLVQVTGTAFVFMFALLGVYSATHAPNSNLANQNTTQTPLSSNSLAINPDTTSPEVKVPGQSNSAALAARKVSASKEAAAITSAVSTELAAEQAASADLFALSDI